MRAMRTSYDKSKFFLRESGKAERPLRGDLYIAVRLTRFDKVNKRLIMHNA